jgi:hypothetical protein
LSAILHNGAFCYTAQWQLPGSRDLPQLHWDPQQTTAANLATISQDTSTRSQVKQTVEALLS